MASGTHGDGGPGVPGGPLYRAHAWLGQPPEGCSQVPWDAVAMAALTAMEKGCVKLRASQKPRRGPVAADEQAGAVLQQACIKAVATCWESLRSFATLGVPTDGCRRWGPANRSCRWWTGGWSAQSRWRCVGQELVVVDAAAGGVGGPAAMHTWSWRVEATMEGGGYHGLRHPWRQLCRAERPSGTLWALAGEKAKCVAQGGEQSGRDSELRGTRGGGYGASSAPGGDQRAGVRGQLKGL